MACETEVRNEKEDEEMLEGGGRGGLGMEERKN